MLSRVLKLSDIIATVYRKLQQAPEFLTPHEERVAKEIENILDVFDEATKLVSADNQLPIFGI